MTAVPLSYCTMVAKTSRTGDRWPEAYKYEAGGPVNNPPSGANSAAAVIPYEQRDNLIATSYLHSRGGSTTPITASFVAIGDMIHAYVYRQVALSLWTVELLWSRGE